MLSGDVVVEIIALVMVPANVFKSGAMLVMLSLKNVFGWYVLVTEKLTLISN